MEIIKYSKTDINWQLAKDAHYATSMVPEKRADGVVASYLAEMKAMAEEFAKYATDSNRASIAADLECYRQGYIKKLNAYLSAHSRVMSAFITGPSNFPTARNEKRGNIADKRRDEFLEYCKKIKRRLRRTYNPRLLANAPISSDDGDAIEQLKKKIDKAQAQQDLMKAANAIVRKKTITDEEKVVALAKFDIGEETARKAIEFSKHRKLFPSYALTNNNANIRRMKQRIEQLKRERDREVVEDRQVNGVTVSENRDINRLQLFFEGKPPAEVRQRLKANGFRWAPSQGAWQRQLNGNSRYAAEDILKSL
jgi:hypothetical protein